MNCLDHHFLLISEGLSHFPHWGRTCQFLTIFWLLKTTFLPTSWRALLTLHIDVSSREVVWNTAMEQSRMSGKPGQFEFWQRQKMFLEVLETVLVSPALERIRQCQPGRKFYHTHTVVPVWSGQLPIMANPGKVRTVVLLSSRMKNVLIYRQGTDHGIKFIWKVNSISTSLCAIVMSIKVFIDGGIAEFEIVMVVGHSWLKVYSTENVIEIWIRWEWDPCRMSLHLQDLP